MKYPAKSVNGTYGYRTPMSMKNNDTWVISQKYGGLSMMIVGLINGVLGLFFILIPLRIDTEIYQLLFSLISSVAMIIIDEIHLNKLFNKDGSRKNS